MHKYNLFKYKYNCKYTRDNLESCTAKVQSASHCARKSHKNVFSLLFELHFTAILLKSNQIKIDKYISKSKHKMLQNQSTWCTNCWPAHTTQVATDKLSLRLHQMSDESFLSRLSEFRLVQGITKYTNTNSQTKIHSYKEKTQIQILRQMNRLEVADVAH